MRNSSSTPGASSGRAVSTGGRCDSLGDLFDSPDLQRREQRLYATLDAIAERFGPDKLTRGPAR